MENANLHTLDDLKKARTDANHAVSVQISSVKKVLAEDKPELQRQLIIQLRTDLMLLFDTFENVHYAYFDMLSKESDQSDTSKLMLENEEDYLMIQTDIYSDTLEEIRHRIGPVSSSQVISSQVESNTHHESSLHFSHVDSVHRPTRSFEYEGAGKIFHGKNKDPCKITHDDSLRYGTRSEILSDKKFGEKFLLDTTDSQSSYAAKQKDEQLTIYSLSSDNSHCHISPIENPLGYDVGAGGAGMRIRCDMQQGPNMCPPSLDSPPIVYDDPVSNDLNISASVSFCTQGSTVPGNQHDARCLIDSRNQNSACNHVNFSASQNFTMRSSSDHVSQVNTDSQPVDFREFLLGKLDLNSPTELKHNYVAAIIGKSNQTEHSMDCNYKETYALVPRVLDVNGKHQAKLGL